MNTRCKKHHLFFSKHIYGGRCNFHEMFASSTAVDLFSTTYCIFMPMEMVKKKILDFEILFIYICSFTLGFQSLTCPFFVFFAPSLRLCERPFYCAVLYHLAADEGTSSTTFFFFFLWKKRNLNSSRMVFASLFTSTPMPCVVGASL